MIHWTDWKWKRNR